MRRSGSRRLFIALLTLLFAIGLAGADAEAGKRKKKRKAKASANVGAKLSSAQLGSLMGPYKWGMSKRDILGILAKQVSARYKKKIAATTDVYRQDKLRRAGKAELNRIKKSYVEFAGKKSGWDVSIIDDQFAHHTGEAMLVHWENSPDTGRDQRRFFFFYDGRLYKMFIALNSSQLKDDQRSFGYFKSLMERRFGAGKVHADKGMIEWKSRTYRVLALDKLSFYGSFCLVMSEPGQEATLASIRKSQKPPKKDNQVIKAVLQGEGKDADTPGLDDNKATVDAVLRTR